MSEESLFRLPDGTPCGAAEAVCRMLGGGAAVAGDEGGGNPLCGALRAALALTPEPKRAALLRKEFVQLAGAAECVPLRGAHCAGYAKLAAELARKYRNAPPAGNRKRVLLLGDSIRRNYEDVVRRELADLCEVTAPEENCRFAKFALNELAGWFDACGEPEVIHWNIGLWDSAVVCPEDGMFTSPEEYLFYMSRILRELRKHTPKIIFATTTPVLPGSLNQQLEYIDRLNGVIVPYMREQKIPVNDLYALVKPRMKELLRQDCIHLNPQGAEVCGRAVAGAIRAVLEGRG